MKKRVSVLTQSFVTIDGMESQVGTNHRKAYVNSDAGRSDLLANEPNDVVTAVMAVWGDSPVVVEPDPIEYVNKDFWDEMADAIEEGVTAV